MAMCTTLNNVLRTHVDFDPTNADHLTAFKMLCLGEDGPSSPIRQHPSLRFNLEVPFIDIRTMMYHKVGAAHMTSILPSV